MCTPNSFTFKTHQAIRLLLLILLSLMLTGCGLFNFGESDPAPAKAKKVVSTAYSQIGKQYRLGGASPSKGFDCSGLVYWVYKKNGYKIPRVTTDQAKCGTGVAERNAREGDIVVFRTSRSPRGLHTGIYAGKNSFIHSPRKGKNVKVDRMDNSYWKDKLVAVRRVVR
ncbi:MAG: C40 family peptidase [Desulfovibrio sp.]|nr:C40 family peptidase [Desulfovibrio sp.]